MGWRRMRRLCSITDSMDINLRKLQEIVGDRGAWRAAVYGVAKSGTWLNKWTTTKEEFFFKKELYCVVISSFEFLIIFICDFPFFPWSLLLRVYLFCLLEESTLDWLINSFVDFVSLISVLIFIISFFLFFQIFLWYSNFLCWMLN